MNKNICQGGSLGEGATRAFGVKCLCCTNCDVIQTGISLISLHFICSKTAPLLINLLFLRTCQNYSDESAILLLFNSKLTHICMRPFETIFILFYFILFYFILFLFLFLFFF